MQRDSGDLLSVNVNALTPATNFFLLTLDEEQNSKSGDVFKQEINTNLEVRACFTKAILNSSRKVQY